MGGRNWPNGSDRGWRRIRAGVLQRNVLEHGGVCQVQVAGVCTGGQADTVHHILGRGVTGDDERYLIACCRPCNLHIGEPGKKNAEPLPWS